MTDTQHILHSNHVIPGSQILHSVTFPECAPIDVPSGPRSYAFSKPIATKWAADFNQTLSDKSIATNQLFHGEACWRDLLCMEWDFHTVQGPDSISRLLAKSSVEHHITSISQCSSPDYRVPQLAACGAIRVIQAFLDVETTSGRGTGLVRLVPDLNGTDRWKAFTLFTMLQEIKGHEENIHSRRPTGSSDTSYNSHLNWKDRRSAQQSFKDASGPVVVILGNHIDSLTCTCFTDSLCVGAGQGGLTVAARLKQLGIETLIIDRNSRVGDNWRNRYHQLVLHDTVW